MRFTTGFIIGWIARSIMSAYVADQFEREMRKAGEKCSADIKRMSE